MNTATKMTLNREGYSYDALTNTLFVSNSFLKKASQMNSREYNLLMQFRATNHDLRLSAVENKSKAPNKSITYAQMEKYIAIFDDEKKTLLHQFETVKKMSKIQASPYKYVKNWFEKTFPNYKKQVKFDENGKITFVKDENEDAAADQTNDAA